MARLWSIVPLLLFSTCVVCGQSDSYQVRVGVKDGNAFVGTCTLPALSVKTKYGVMSCTPDQLASFQRPQAGADAMVTTTTGQVLRGECDLPDLKLKTANGEITIPGADVQQITVERRPTPQQPQQPPQWGQPAQPGGGLPGQQPQGQQPQGQAAEKPSPFWVLRMAEPKATGPLTPTGPGGWYPARSLSKLHAAASDDGAYVAVCASTLDTLYVIDTAAKKCTPVKTEAGPVHVAFGGGAFWVCCSGAGSIVSVDPKSASVTGRIAGIQQPSWLSIGKTSYVIGKGSQNPPSPGIYMVDLAGKKSLGEVRNFENPNGLLFMGGGGLEQSADGRYLYVQGTWNGSPCGSPHVLLSRGGKFVEVNYVHSDFPPLIIDSRGQRVYAGGAIYTLDLKSQTGKLDVGFCVPAPDKGLILAARKGGNEPLAVPQVITAYAMGALTAFDSVDLGRGQMALGIFPGKETVHVLTESDYFAIPFAEFHAKGTPAAAGAGPTGAAPAAGEASAADQAKAKEAVKRGEAALKDKKYDEATAAFDEAMKLDALSAGVIGKAKVMNAQSKWSDAIDLLSGQTGTPFREDAAIIEVNVVLGTALVGADRAQEGVRVFQDALKLEKDSVPLLSGLGMAAAAAKNDRLAYCAWTRAMKQEGCPSTVKKLLEDCTARIKKATRTKCPECKGAGEHEIVQEDAQGRRSKLISKCDTCQGAKEVWERPCADCWAVDSWYNDCKKCYGRGFFYEPAK